jgi:hypothetical protein
MIYKICAPGLFWLATLMPCLSLTALMKSVHIQNFDLIFQYCSIAIAAAVIIIIIIIIVVVTLNSLPLQVI